MITTHALLARKVQRKLRNGVAGFAAGGSSSDRKRSPIRAFSATPHDGQRAERLLKSPAEPSPELRIPSAAAQTRVVSMAGIRLGSRESARAFKGIICDDVSEFESHMPSHAVGLYGVIFRRAHCSGSWFETRPHALFDATELVSQPLTPLRRK